MRKQKLTVAKVAKIAECHPNTVKNYTSRGYITATRDCNGFRRYSLDQAIKLKEILGIRKRDGNG